MQYKIPVQIENEDPIMLGLSLRQIMIIMIGFGIAYTIYNNILPSVGPEVALIPGVIIVFFAIVMAVFKYSEMTFLPFVLSFIRYKVNMSERRWMKTVDSFSVLEIGFVASPQKKHEKVDFGDKIDKIKTLDEKLEKI